MATLEHVGGTESERIEKTAAGGSLVELVAGAAAIVLPILGLIGVLPISLAAISFIAIGGALMTQGGALSAHSNALVRDADRPSISSRELVGGMSAEILGGAAVSALGILGLLRIAPITLLAAAAIVAGGALVLGAGTTSRLSAFAYGSARLDETKREVMRESVNAAAGGDVLVGLGSIVLGILVLANVSTGRVQTILLLVAALGLGGGLFLNGTTVGARMTALLRHSPT